MEKAYRKCGVFVPLFALRGGDDRGIGDTRALKEMIAWCGRHHLSVLQILPVNETSGDNSPYNAISSVALEPTTLSLRVVDIPGLSESHLRSVCERHPLPESFRHSVPYGRVRARVREATWEAMDHLPAEEEASLGAFRQTEKEWLEPYVHFRALMEWNGENPVWQSWPQEHRNPEWILNWRDSLEASQQTAFNRLIRYYSYLQWVLDRQWTDVRMFGLECNVRLMGDIPYGISRHSADVWANPKWFDLNWCGGAPPEPFFQGDEFIRKWGQNWGVPHYRWQEMESDGYSWWRRRVSHVTRYFDLFRIDHVLGFYRVYSFPWTPDRNGEFVDKTEADVKSKLGRLPQFLPASDETAEGAETNREQGERLLRMILEAAGASVVIGEDLGVVPDYVRPSLRRLGISGFKIPIFEKDEATGEYKPAEDYPALSVATLSTHDHFPMRRLWRQWWESWEEGQNAPEGSEERSNGERSSWELYRTQRFLGLQDNTPIREFEPMIREGWIRKLLQCPSWLTLFMIPDLFGLETRFNVPGPVAETNWSQRLPFSVEDLETRSDLSGITVWLEEEIRAAARGA